MYYSAITYTYYIITNLFMEKGNTIISNPTPFLVTFTLVAIIILWRNVYHFSFYYYIHKIAKTLSIAVLISFTISLLLTFLYNSFFTNRELTAQSTEILLFYGLGLVLFLTLVHFVQFLWIKHLGNLGYFHKKVLIIGEKCTKYQLKHHFNDIWNSREFAGTLIQEEGTWYYNNKEMSINYKNWEELIYKKNIGQVILFTDDKNKDNEATEILKFLNFNDIPYSIYKRNSKGTDIKWGKELTIPLCYKKNVPSRDSLRMITVKRLSSILFALFGIIAGLPFWIFIALSIKLHDKGPIFYVSKRVGKNGKMFDFYKFRTMVMNADKMKDELMKFNERQDGPLFKMKNDPRVTPIGKILRKFSLDEFPQLINILKGDMCFIGPRPHLPKEVAEYESRDFLRLECIPGLSCLPQINDRNNIGFRDWVELDLKYRKEWSLFLDIKIFFKTIGVALEPLLKKDGGY